MEKSTHKVEVVSVHPRPHPNADKLELADVFGYQVCIGKGDFTDGELGIYLPPDSIVPVMDQFKFVWENKGYTPEAIPQGQLPASAEVEAVKAIYDIPEKYRRIKAKTLRGEISEGLLLPVRSFPMLFVPEPGKYYLSDGTVHGVKEGDDVATLLGVGHYDPPDPTTLRGDCEKAPVTAPKRKKNHPRTLRGWVKHIFYRILAKTGIRKERVAEVEERSLEIPAYDVDAWQRHKSILIPDEQIWVTEKIHGANSRFVFMDGRMWAGSHYQWKKNAPGSAWWECLKQNPWIESFCTAHPGFVLYGELTPTQKFKYGQENGKYRLFAFDVLDTNQRTPGNNGKWLSFYELHALLWTYPYMEGERLVERFLLDEVHWVPTVGILAYDEAGIRKLSDGPSLVEGASHIREGIVIKPTTERSHARFGRVLLKIVSVAYLGSKNSD